MMRQALCAAALLVCSTAAHAEPIERDQIEVRDGDTVRIGGALVRLVGFDAPETRVGEYRCDAERERGQVAAKRLEEILNSNVLDIRYRKHPDRYGRPLALLKVNGKNVGDRWSLRAGQQDKPLYGLAIAKLEEAIRVAFASKYGKVMVANFGTADPVADWRKFKEWQIPDSAGGYTHSLAVGRTAGTWLLAAGTEDGEVVIWDFQTGAINARCQGAHLGSINVLFFDEGGEILISCGRDGRVRFWTAGLHALFDINIGQSVIAADWLDSNRLAVGTHRGVLMLDVNRQRMARLTSSLR